MLWNCHPSSLPDLVVDALDVRLHVHLLVEAGAAVPAREPLGVAVVAEGAPAHLAHVVGDGTEPGHVGGVGTRITPRSLLCHCLKLVVSTVMASIFIKRMQRAGLIKADPCHQ